MNEHDRLVAGVKSSAPRPKSYAKTVREVLVPWILAMEPGEDLDIQGCVYVLKKARKYSYWGIHDAIRPVLEYLVEEGFLVKDSSDRRRSVYTRIKFE